MCLLLVATLKGRRKAGLHSRALPAEPRQAVPPQKTKDGMVLSSSAVAFLQLSSSLCDDLNLMWQLHRPQWTMSLCLIHSSHPGLSQHLCRDEDDVLDRILVTKFQIFPCFEVPVKCSHCFGALPDSFQESLLAGLRVPCGVPGSEPGSAVGKVSVFTPPLPWPL